MPATEANSEDENSLSFGVMVSVPQSVSMFTALRIFYSHDS